MSAERDSREALLFDLEMSESNERAVARYAGETPALPANRASFLFQLKANGRQKNNLITLTLCLSPFNF